MDNEIYAYDVPLKDIKPFIDPIKKYFGLNHPSLELGVMQLDIDPEREFTIIARVPAEKIESILNASFPKLEEDERQYYLSILWLVCNLYYGESNDVYEDYYENEVSQEYNIWNCIRRDILELYIFMQDHKEGEKVSIQFGKGKGNKVTLDNSFRWFQGLLDNQLFRNCIPEITSREQAKKQLSGKAGRPEGRREVNAMINGLAKMLKEEGVVTASAPKELLCFIYDILLEMNLAKPGDKVLDLDNIKAQISNFKKPGKDARFFTPEIRECSIEDLKKAPLHEKGLDWLLKKPQK